MRVKLLTGRHAGEIQDVRLDAAQALIASGQAVEVKNDDSAQPAEPRRALGTDDYETATDEAAEDRERAVLKRGKKSGA